MNLDHNRQARLFSQEAAQMCFVQRFECVAPMAGKRPRVIKSAGNQEA